MLNGSQLAGPGTRCALGNGGCGRRHRKRKVSAVQGRILHSRGGDFGGALRRSPAALTTPRPLPPWRAPWLPGGCCRDGAAYRQRLSMIRAARGADASAPQPPCSTRTTTAISGLRRGATPTNQALARSAPVPRLFIPALWFTTCAVPVLPAKSMFSRRTADAVPPMCGSRAPAMLSVMVCQTAVSIGTCTSPVPE